MRVFRYAAALLVLLSTACGAGEPEDQAAEAEKASEPAPAEPAITAAFQGSGAGSGITGQAQVTSGADGFTLAVTVSGAPAGPHAWHIHQAACGVSGAPIVVALSEKPGMPAVSGELQVAEDGTASTQVQVPASLVTMDQLRTGDYSLHIHQTGGAQHGPSIACATL
jgi:Cu/Zn superoxide dismutase